MDKSENFAICFSVSFDHYLISAGRGGGRAGGNDGRLEKH